VKARVPNETEVLWPGAYVTVTVILDGGEPQVAVPGAAVQLGQDGPYVFVVKDGKSELRQITVARNAGTDAVVTKGVGAGEDVVVEGQLRLVDGAPVSVKPSAAAEDAPAPMARKS
jgi:multidrug efflux system membrane fusion protein